MIDNKLDVVNYVTYNNKTILDNHKPLLEKLKIYDDTIDISSNFYKFNTYMIDNILVSTYDVKFHVSYKKYKDCKGPDLIIFHITHNGIDEFDNLDIKYELHFNK